MPQRPVPEDAAPWDVDLDAVIAECREVTAEEAALAARAARRGLSGGTPIAGGRRGPGQGRQETAEGFTQILFGGERPLAGGEHRARRQRSSRGPMSRAADAAWRRPQPRQAYARSDHAYQARTWRGSSCTALIPMGGLSGRQA